MSLNEKLAALEKENKSIEEAQERDKKNLDEKIKTENQLLK